MPTVVVYFFSLVCALCVVLYIFQRQALKEQKKANRQRQREEQAREREDGEFCQSFILSNKPATYCRVFLSFSPDGWRARTGLTRFFIVSLFSFLDFVVASSFTTFTLHCS